MPRWRPNARTLYRSLWLAKLCHRIRENLATVEGRVTTPSRSPFARTIAFRCGNRPLDRHGVRSRDRRSIVSLTRPGRVVMAISSATAHAVTQAVQPPLPFGEPCRVHRTPMAALPSLWHPDRPAVTLCEPAGDYRRDMSGEQRCSSPAVTMICAGSTWWTMLPPSVDRSPDRPAAGPGKQCGNHRQMSRWPSPARDPSRHPRPSGRVPW